MALSNKRYHSLIFLFLCLFVAVAVFLFLGSQKAFLVIEAKMLDYRFQLRGPIDISKDIVLISIGPKDIELLGRWPWPRKYHSDFISVLNSCGVKVIGFDILFHEHDKNDPDSDLQLASTAKETGKVFFPMAFARKETAQPDLLPILPLREASCGVGFVNTFPDEDGIVRRTPIRVEGRLAFGVALASRFLGITENGIELIPGKSLALHVQDGDRITIPLDEKNRMLVNYPGVTEDWQWLHFAQIIMAYMEEQEGEKPSIDLKILKDKIVLVGSTSTGIPDIIWTPFNKPSYGVEFHSSVINSILHRNVLRPLPSLVDVIIFFLVTLGTALILLRHRPLKGGLVSGTILLTFIAFSYILFSKFNIYLKVVGPVTGLLAVYMTGLIYHFITVQRKEREVRKAFHLYVSPAVVSDLMKEPEKLKLGGNTKELTLLFSDIRGFTTFSEKLTPDFLGDMLNEYFSLMTSSIFAHGGTLDKFIGDAVMAIFGAPLDLPGHPLNGCLSARSMISNLNKLNIKWESEGKNPIKIGIGLHTGKVKVGNFGSHERFDYTVIGENVNLASRLEGLTKPYGVDIIISDATYKNVEDKMLCRQLDRVMVKGSNKPLEIFELIGVKNDLSEKIMAKVQDYQKCLKLYYSRQWEEAQRNFVCFLDRFPNDRPAQIFLERAKIFRKYPPKGDWDGLFSHTTK